MKKWIPALALSLALTLGGCSLSGQSYTVVEPHAEHPVLGENESTIKASTYSELVNGVLFFVSQGVEEGVIQITDYNGDVEDDLNRACLEVAKDDPLGAYAVDFIKNDYTTIITTYEATITISYRRSPEQVSSLVNITGTSAIREEAVQALSAFKTELALRVGYFTGDAAAVEEQVRQAYYDTPAAALGMPECSVALYPETGAGTQRIVEIVLTYPEEPAILTARSGQLQQEVENLLAPLRSQSAGSVERLSQLFALLPGTVRYDPDGGPTAWDAILGDGANSEGMALAFQLLAQEMGVTSTLVEGTLDGQPHFWNRLSDNGVHYVDLTRDRTGTTWSAEDLLALGYQWDDAPNFEEN